MKSSLFKICLQLMFCRRHVAPKAKPDRQMDVISMVFPKTFLSSGPPLTCPFLQALQMVWWSWRNSDCFQDMLYRIHGLKHTQSVLFPTRFCATKEHQKELSEDKVFRWQQTNLNSNCQLDLVFVKSKVKVFCNHYVKVLIYERQWRQQQQQWRQGYNNSSSMFW